MSNISNVSDTYSPLRRSERLHLKMQEKYITNTKWYMKKITTLLGDRFRSAELKERIFLLTETIRILTKGFKFILLYGISDIRTDPADSAHKMFKGMYFRSFIWMQDTEKEPEAGMLLGKQVNKYRKMYRAYRRYKIGIGGGVHGLNDDLVDIIDSYMDK